ncbi:MAG TPA: hypothetical protein VFJ19_17370 [Nocardioidaceae bacterium]|nr:hypothetical protein [Nocardioidaceae bacterium]
MARVTLVSADGTGAVSVDPVKDRGEYLQALARGLRPAKQAPPKREPQSEKKGDEK